MTKSPTVIYAQVMKHARVDTVDDVVDALGGAEAVGERLGIGKSAVYNWKMRGEIPTGWHLRIYLALRRLGYRVSLSIFQLEDEDTEPPARSRIRRVRRRGESRVAA